MCELLCVRYVRGCFEWPSQAVAAWARAARRAARREQRSGSGEEESQAGARCLRRQPRHRTPPPFPLVKSLPLPRAAQRGRHNITTPRTLPTPPSLCQPHHHKQPPPPHTHRRSPLRRAPLLALCRRAAAVQRERVLLPIRSQGIEEQRVALEGLVGEAPARAVRHGGVCARRRVHVGVFFWQSGRCVGRQLVGVWREGWREA